MRYCDDKRVLGINGMMKTFPSKDSFSGSWEEDLDNSINVFDTFSIKSELTPPDRFKSIPLRLSRDSLSFSAVNM